MGKVIFRKIGGRIVPIRISSAKMESAMGWQGMRQITAKVNNKLIASMDYGKKIYKNSVLKIGEVGVDKEFQGVGIGRALYDRLLEIAKRGKFKKIEGTTLISSKAAKIRKDLGSDFYVGQSKRKITGEKAIEMINKYDRQIKAYNTGKSFKIPRRKDIWAVTRLKKVKSGK